jgi:DNA-directed RNA polymerase subunit RPC12/RpoP
LRSLLNNPLVRFLARMWWLPAMLLVIIPFLPRVGPGTGWLAAGAAALLGLAAGTLAPPTILSWTAGRRAQNRRNAEKLRFLCPACLCFGDFRYACGGCDKELNPMIIQTSGRLVDRCPHCHQKVSGGEQPGTDAVKAFCGACGADHELAVHHRRRVRVLGTLVPADFDTVTAGASSNVDPKGVRWTRRDDGAELTYLLSLGDLAGSRLALPAEHAARRAESLWLSEADPLALGQAVDSYLTLAELDDERLAAMAGCVRSEQLDPAATRLLSARFGSVKFGVAAAEFFPTPAIAGQDGSRVPLDAPLAERSSTT